MRLRFAFQSTACVISHVTCHGRGRTPRDIETRVDPGTTGDETAAALVCAKPDDKVDMPPK